MARLSRDILDGLKKKYNTDRIWSFSRMNSYVNMPWEYYIKYVLREKVDTSNAWTYQGTAVHDIIQDHIEGKYSHEKMLELFDELQIKHQIEKPELKFPSDSIKENYIENLRHYFKYIDYSDIKDLETAIEMPIKVVFKDSQGNLTEAKAHAGVEAKKGMDISQTFGASSTYARKYALNGLFLIDDSHDADSNEYRQNAEGQSSQQNNQQRNNNAQQSRGQQIRDVTPATQQQAASTKPKRSIEERFQAALSQIQFTNDPNLLDTALGVFAPTKYAREIENACRARADQMGWTKGNINQQRLLRH